MKLVKFVNESGEFYINPDCVVCVYPDGDKYTVIDGADSHYRVKENISEVVKKLGYQEWE